MPHRKEREQGKKQRRKKGTFREGNSAALSQPPVPLTKYTECIEESRPTTRIKLV
jgi:hypothetical protein